MCFLSDAAVRTRRPAGIRGHCGRRRSPGFDHAFRHFRNGSGNLGQTKARAEAGLAPQRDEAGALILDAAGRPTLAVVTERSGLPPQPTRLALADVRWGGATAPQVAEMTIQDDGTLHLEAQPPSRDAIVPDPTKWSPSVFEAEVSEHGPWVIEQGGADILRATYGTEGSTTTALLEGWRWSATTGDTPSLWVARLKFWASKPPVVLWQREGNARIVVDDRTTRLWCFGSGSNRVFLVPSQEHWYLAVESSGPEAPDHHHVHLVRSVLGFLTGEPINVGIFRPFDQRGTRPGLAHLGLLNHSSQEASRQPPALPLRCSPTWKARFVDGLLCLTVDDSDVPLLEVIHMYFAAVSGFAESKFLHSWVATEMLAKWGMEAGRFPDAGQLRLADHGAWVAWVRGQRAFEGLGLTWTDEMEDAQRARHGVAHEGALPGNRDWDRDRARVGLVKTMVTALLAKAIGYEGPIADRAKTVVDINGEDEPDWWPAADLDHEVAHEGAGVAESRQRLIAEFARLEVEQGADALGDSTEQTE